MPMGKMFKFKRKTAASKIKSSGRKVDDQQTKAIQSLQRQINKVKYMPELKYVYHNRAFGAAVDGAQFFSLNVLRQGDDVDQREGNQIRMVSLSISLLFTHQAVDRTFFRVVIYETDQNNNSNTTDVTEIINDTANSLGTIISQFNSDFVGKDKKFRIMFNKRFRVTAGATSGPAADLSAHAGENDKSLFITKSFRLGTKKVHYSADNGNALDIVDNVIRLLVVSNGTDSSWGYESKLMFTDS